MKREGRMEGRREKRRGGWEVEGENGRSVGSLEGGVKGEMLGPTLQGERGLDTA